MPDRYHIYPLGDHAITIELGNGIDEQINRKCLDVAGLLSRSNIHGVKDIVPAYASVSVIYDPVAVSQVSHTNSAYEYIRQIAEHVLSAWQPSVGATTRKIIVPACFDLSFAPDLALLAEQKRLTINEVIHIFLKGNYRVYLIGFLPGFAYMGKVDDAIATGRKEKPHPDIQPGSIGIAGNQTGIYPLNSPGGWNIIGRTPLRLFNKDATDPFLLHAGDQIAFRQITTDEFHHLNQNE